MNNNLLKLVILLITFLNCSCAKNVVYPENYFSNTPRPSHFPKVNVNDCDFQVVGNGNQFNNLENDTLKYISIYFGFSDNSMFKNDIELVSVGIRIENRQNNEMLPMVIASTLFFPMSFARQSKSVSFYIDYQFIDNSSHQLFSRNLYGSISGRFLGWSFFRYRFSDELIADQSYLLPRAISGLICNDIVDMYKNIEPHP